MATGPSSASVVHQSSLVLLPVCGQPALAGPAVKLWLSSGLLVCLETAVCIGYLEE